MSAIQGIDTCKQVDDPGFWMNCVNRIVKDLDEAGHQDRVREIREMLCEVWRTLPDKPDIAMCHRCGALPGMYEARLICGNCDGVKLCQACFERRAREVFDEGREQFAPLTGEALARFEAAADVVTEVAVRNMAAGPPLSLNEFLAGDPPGHGYWEAGDAP
jgi:hypothetical protein